MGILVLISIVLAAGIWFGFLMGFSRSMRHAALRLQRRSWYPARGRMPLGFGCLAVLIGAGLALHSWHFVHTAARANGVITEMRLQRNQKEQTISYAPTFAFRDIAGVEHTVRSSLYAYPPHHRVGDGVTILYRPDAPQSARIDAFWYLWFAPTTVGILGGLFLLAGFFAWCSPRIFPRFG